MVDRVQVMKRESTDLGGDDADAAPWPEPIEPQEDAIEVAGVYLQDVTARDETSFIWRDGDDIKFKDVNNASGHTLTQLAAAGSGITAAQHKALRDLIHFIDDGPADGFSSGAYREILPAGSPFPTLWTWWESSAKLKRIVDLTVTRNSNKTPATEQWRIYDTDGTTVLATVTDTIAYSGVIETSRTRTL